MTDPDLRDALDALEAMVFQYLDGDTATGFDHNFMTAGEQACEVLARLRPRRWELTSTGIAPGGGYDEPCPGSGTNAYVSGLAHCPKCGRRVPTRPSGIRDVLMDHPADGSWVGWRRGA